MLLFGDDLRAGVIAPSRYHDCTTKAIHRALSKELAADAKTVGQGTSVNALIIDAQPFTEVDTVTLATELVDLRRGWASVD